MRLDDELVAPLRAVAERFALPKVRALHLPPREAVQAARRAGRGEFCLLELDDGTPGAAYVMLDDDHEALLLGHGTEALAGADALALAASFGAARAARRVVAWAALGALSRWLVERAGLEVPRSGDPWGRPAPLPGEHLGMVGLFTPMVAPLLQAGLRLTVLELQPELAGRRDALTVTLDPAALQDCPRIVCTATTLINGSLEALLPHLRHAHHLALLGPSAGCLPDALFARGVTQIGGRWITDPAGAIDAVRAGRGLGEVSRKFAFSRDDWPGCPALLERL